MHLRVLHKGGRRVALCLALACISGTAEAATDEHEEIEALIHTVVTGSPTVRWTRSRVLEIDFGLGAVNGEELAALIEALALAERDRDPVLFLSVNIRRGKVDTDLHLDGLDIGFRLRFDHMHFANVAFENITLNGQLIFNRSLWDGFLFIDNSTLEDGLRILDNSIFRDAAKSLHINKTRIARDLTIVSAQFFGEVWFYDNQIEPSLRIENNVTFYQGARMRDNDLGDLIILGARFHDFLSVFSNMIDRVEIKGTKHFGLVQISQNRISDALWIINNAFNHGQSLTSLGVQIDINTVLGELYFQPSVISYGIEHLSFAGSEVHRLASIRIPEGRTRLRSLAPLHVDLDYGTFASLLVVGSDGRSRDAELSTYCFENSRSEIIVSVGLTSARAARFRWPFPASCGFVWSGNGFVYEQWLDQAGRDSAASLPNWRFQLSRPEPNALLKLAAYLHEQGQFTVSRQIMFEAKEFDYRPRRDCLPMLSGDQTTLRFWAEESCIRQHMLHKFLLTAGFGVKPEYSAVALALSWLVGVLVYYPYCWIVRSRGRPRENPDGSGSPEHGLAEEGGRWREPSVGLVSPPLQPTAGNVAPAGFRLYDADRFPKDFRLWIFSADATLPVVDLHAYKSYYPELFLVRCVSFMQHIAGWWCVTSLVTSLAVL